MSDLRVGFTPNIQTSAPVKKTQDVGKNDDKANVQAQTPKTDYKPADQILNQMAASANVVPNTKTDTTGTNEVSGKKTIAVSKYVDGDSAKRIAGSVNDCITALFGAEETAIKEFGLSPKAAQALAVDAYNQQYMPDMVGK